MSEYTKERLFSAGEKLIIPCKFCDCSKTNYYITDEIDFFEDNTGSVIMEYLCPSCKEVFRVYYEFEYQFLRVDF